jgi:hypothetical protein
MTRIFRIHIPSLEIGKTAHNGPGPVNECKNVRSHSIERLLALRPALCVTGRSKYVHLAVALFPRMIFLSLKDKVHTFYRTMKNDK